MRGKRWPIQQDPNLEAHTALFNQSLGHGSRSQPRVGMSNIVQPPVALDKNSPYSNQCLGMDNMRGSGVYFPNVCLFKTPPFHVAPHVCLCTSAF